MSDKKVKSVFALRKTRGKKE